MSYEKQLQRFPRRPKSTSGEAGPPGAAATVLKGMVALSVVRGREASAVFSAPGVSESNVVFADLAPCGPSDENDPEMLDLVALSVRPGLGEIAVTAVFSEVTSGPVKINWSAF